MTDIRLRSVTCTKCQHQRDVDASEFLEHYSKVHLNVEMFKCTGCAKTFATPFFASLHPCKSTNKKIELIMDLSTGDARSRMLAAHKGYNDAVRQQQGQINKMVVAHLNQAVEEAKKEGAAECAASLKQGPSGDQTKEGAKSKYKTATFKKPPAKVLPEVKKKPQKPNTDDEEEDEDTEPIDFVYGGRDEPKAKKAKIDEKAARSEERITKKELMDSLTPTIRHFLEEKAKARSTEQPPGSNQPTGNKKENGQGGKGDVQVHMEETNGDGVLYVPQNTQQTNVTVTIAEEYQNGKDDRGQRLNGRVSLPTGRK